MAENQMNKDEQVGVHKGSLSVLAAERNELVRMVTVVEQLMQAHIKALKDLGVDLEAEAKKQMAANPQQKQQPGQQQKKNSLTDRF